MRCRVAQLCWFWAVSIAMLCCSAVADAQTIIARKRLGNNTEGITFFPEGNTKNVAITDGYDVFSVMLPHTVCPAGGPCHVFPPKPVPAVWGLRRQLFSLRSLAVLPPRGIVYVPSQDRFYFSAVDASRLYVTDAKGAVLTPLLIQHIGDPGEISQWEGLTYIPPDSPVFPDTIAGITIHRSGLNSIAHIQIIRLDGVVVREVVFPADSPLSTHLFGIAYKAPDRLLLGSPDNGVIFETTIDGVIATQVATIGSALTSLEGLTTLDDGRIVAADYTSGRLFVLDSAFQRRPNEDRGFVVGFGLTSTGRLAWNSDSDEFLVSRASFGGSAESVFAVSSNLTRSRRVVDLAGTPFFSVSGLGYLAGEKRVAIATGRSVAFFDTTTGSYVSRIALDTPFPFPRAVTPLPGDLLGLRVSGALQDVRVITRTGTPHPTDPTAVVPTQLPGILLSSPPDGIGLSFYSGSAGDEILAGFSFYDLGGNHLRTIEKSALGVFGTAGVAPITSGRHQGRFALLDTATSELIVFSLAPQ